MKNSLLLSISILLAAISLQAQTQITFYTTMGNFVVSMEQAKRPITTANFINLVKNKFYDKIIFHRVIDGFMIQGGDPTGTGYGGSGVIIQDELTPLVSNLQKTISMANSGPNTGTSQFFINLVNNAYLDPKHPVFGTVITNFSVVQAIGKVPVNASRPITDVVMDSLRITYVPTGIDQMAAPSADISIYPNPVTDESVISIRTTTNSTAKVSVYDKLGKKVYDENRSLSNGVNYISLRDIQTADLPQGTYYLVVTDKNTISRHSFVLIR
jgi:cyclophilin family peptidyl-prolyl cis-trans isomerase